MKKLVYLLLLVFVCTTAVNAQFINEIHYDNASGDVGEFVEVALPAGTDPTTFTITLYNGSGGASYDSYTLTAGDMGSTDGTYDYYTWFPSSIQNGPDGIALDNGGTLIEFISYEGSFAATDGVANLQTATDIGVSESGATAIGESLANDGSGTWSVATDDTPGQSNSGGSTPTCSISGVAVNGSCSGADYVFDVSFTTANLIDAGGTVEVFDNTNSSVLASGTTSPITITLAGNTSTVSFDIIVRDATDNTCASGAVTVTPQDCSAPPSSCPGGFVNEFHYDNGGADVGEFVEVALPAGSTPGDYTITLYNGSGGGSYDSFTLTATEFGSTDGTYDYYVWSPSSIQNGPDGIALDYQGSVCDFVSYEGGVTATDGPANGQSSTDVGVGEDGATLVGASISLNPVSGVWETVSADTRGFANNAAPVCSISGVTPGNAACSGTDFTFDVAFFAADLVDAGGTVEVYDSISGTVLASGSTSPISVLVPASTTQLNIIVRDATDNTCASSAVAITPINCPPVDPGCNSNSGNFPWGN